MSVVYPEVRENCKARSDDLVILYVVTSKSMTYQRYRQKRKYIKKTDRHTNKKIKDGSLKENQNMVH